MNCKNCGSPLTPGSNSCNVCGMEVEQPIVSDNNSTNQNVAVPTLGLDQNNQQPINDGTTVPNMTAQNDLLQQSQVSQTNDTEAPVQTPVTPVESSIPSTNPFMNNQTPDSQNVNSVGSVNENSIPDMNQTSIESGSQPNLAGNNDIPNGLGVDQTSYQDASSQSIGTDNQGQMLSENTQTVDNTPMNQVPLEEVQQQPKKKSKIGLIVILVLVLAIVGFFVFQYISLTSEANKVKNNNTNNNQQIPSEKEDDTSKENENNQAENNNPNNDNNVLTAAKVSELYKNDLIQNGLYNVANTESFDITTVKYLGYYENDPSIKYYALTGSFKCLDNSYQCVYMAQIGDEPVDFKYGYDGVVSLKEDNGELVVSDRLSPTFENEIKYDPETAAGFVLVDEILS